MLSGRSNILLAGVLILIGCSGRHSPEQTRSGPTVSPDSVRTENKIRFAGFVRPLPANRISPYDPIIKKYSRRFGFDWRLIAAQIYTESHFRPNVRSRVGAVGLMQVLPSTAKHMGLDPKLLLKPEYNISIGCLYDRRLYNLWNDKEGKNRLAFTLASYNAGRRTVLNAASRAKSPHRWELVKPHLPRETQNYVKKIFDRYEIYKRRFF